MKRITINSLILAISATALLVVVYLRNAFLFSPGHLLIPRNLQVANIVDVLLVCILPALLTAAVYVFLSIYSKNADRNFVKSVLNFLPYVLLVAVILAYDNTFSHAARNFGVREFLSYETYENIAFAFPNASRIWLMVISTSVVLSVLKQLFQPYFVRNLGFEAGQVDAAITADATKTAAPKRRVSVLLYYIATVLIPSILLFHLYNNNRVENFLVFNHVLILAGVLAVIGVLLFLIFKSAAKSPEGALVLCVLFWLGFWLFETLFSVAVNIYASLTSTQLILLLVTILATVAAIFRHCKPPGEAARTIFNALSLVFAGLFIFNLVPGVNHEIMLHRARAAVADEDSAPFYIKRDFYINETLPTPDIYWVHLDGMMSMETIEHFFGVCQEHLREEISQRGFIVYPNAELNAGSTASALPALLSPMFYDSFWGGVLKQVDTELRNERERSQSNKLMSVGTTWHEINSSYELLSALQKRGYDVIAAGDLPEMIQRSLTNEHRQFAGVWHRALTETGDLPNLLNHTTPLNIALSEARADFGVLQASYDYEHIARFTWMTFRDTHMVHVWSHNPTIHDLDFTAIHVYPLAYAQIALNALSFVDTVLEENPNAVIILQSDHGFHVNQTQSYMLQQGYSLEQVMELCHTVFSAVRIPEQYGGLDAPIAPLNISRELVNRFVGQNYELLP